MEGEHLMCFGDPTKSLAIARERTTPEQWAKFQREFEDFTITSGYPDLTLDDLPWHEWVRWAFFSARPREHERIAVKQTEFTAWFPCTTPPVRDGWYEVQRGKKLALTKFSPVLLGPIERVRFKNGAWDRDSCESKIGVWVSWDCWRGVTKSE
jgi:hypothetical protein